MKIYFLSFLEKHANIILSFLIGIAFVLMGDLYFLQKYFIPKKSNSHIVTVNVTGLVNDYVSEIAKSSLTPEQAKLNISNFSAQLEAALKKISIDEHAVVVPSQAVLEGAADRTRLVVEIMKASSKK